MESLSNMKVAANPKINKKAEEGESLSRKGIETKSIDFSRRYNVDSV